MTPIITHPVSLFPTRGAKAVIAEFVAEKFSALRYVSYVLNLDAGLDDASLIFYDENGLELWLPESEGGDPVGNTMLLESLDLAAWKYYEPGGFTIGTNDEAVEKGEFTYEDELAA